MNSIFPNLHTETLWTQALIYLLVLLVSCFLLYILAQVALFSFKVLGTKERESRSNGGWVALGGLLLTTLAVGLILAQDYLGFSTVVVPYGMMFVGLLGLVEGLGVMLFGRIGVGAMLLMWSIIGGVVFLIVRCYKVL